MRKYLFCLSYLTNLEVVSALCRASTSATRLSRLFLNNTMSKYHRASTDSSAEGEEVDHVRFVPSRSFSSRLITYMWRGTTVCLAIFGSFILFNQLWLHLKTPQEISCSCGTSLAEAAFLNCKYDSIAAAYLPPHCRDDELTALFDKSGPAPDGSWYYYSDWDKTSTLNLSQIAAMGGTREHFFTTHEWHIAHCTWTWRKQVRAKDTGITIDKRSRGVDHVAHCEMMFMKRDALDAVVTGSGVALDADLLPVPHKHHPEDA